MPSLIDLTRELKLIGDLKNLVEVYEETSAEKMKQMREKIVTGRDFLTEIAGLSAAVGADMAKAMTQKPATAAVFLSANEGLYGSLINDVFHAFLTAVKTENLTAVVIGETGRQLMTELAPQIKYRYLDYIEETGSDGIGPIKALLKDYSRLKVFFARFKNIISQQPIMEELTGQMVLDLAAAKSAAGTGHWQFIYEPSTPAVAAKFSREIWHNLFIGLMDEHRLAKQGARLMQLDQAIEKIDERSGQMSAKVRMASKKIEDKKQQGRMVRLRP